MNVPSLHKPSQDNSHNISEDAINRVNHMQGQIWYSRSERKVFRLQSNTLYIDYSSIFAGYIEIPTWNKATHAAITPLQLGPLCVGPFMFHLKIRSTVCQVLMRAWAHYRQPKRCHHPGIILDRQQGPINLFKINRFSIYLTYFYKHRGVENSTVKNQNLLYLFTYWTDSNVPTHNVCINLYVLHRVANYIAMNHYDRINMPLIAFNSTGLIWIFKSFHVL